MPRMSWRPTTGQLTTVAIAVVFLLVGFWIGWQHRATTNPATVTPSVPRGMRTKAVIVVPPTATGTGTGTGTQTTGTTTTSTTAPAALLPPRSQVKVTVLNAGGTAGAAVQVAVTLVRLGYPTPVTGNVSLPPSLVPTSTAAAPAATAPTTTRTGTSPGATSTAPHTTRTSSTTAGTPSLPMVVYYGTGDQALASRLAGDLGVSATAPLSSSAVIKAAAQSAQLIVIIGT